MMRQTLAALACAAVLAAAPALAQQIQTGTPRDTNAAPSVTNNGTAQPADTNPSTEAQTGTAGPSSNHPHHGNTKRRVTHHGAKSQP